MHKYTECHEHLETLVWRGGYSHEGNEIALREALLSLELDKEISNGLIPEQTTITVTFDNWFVEEPIKLRSDISHRVMEFRLSTEELFEMFEGYDGGPFFWPCDSFEVVEWNSFPITDKSIPQEIIELFCEELVDRVDLSWLDDELERGELDDLPELVVKIVKVEVGKDEADLIENPSKTTSGSSPLTHGEI